MKRRRLIWQLFPSYMLITLLSLLAVTLYTASTLRNFFIHETEANLEARVRLIEPEMLNMLAAGNLDSLESVVTDLGSRSQTRITIIRPDGKVLADSNKDPALMDLHNTRPEVIPALGGGRGSSSRYSKTLQEDMMYVAVPLFDGDQLIAVARTSKSLKSVNQAIQMLLVSIGLGSLIIALGAALSSWLNARWIANPLEHMKLHARRIAAGNLSGRLPEEGTEEVAALAEAINLMLTQLDERVKIIERQRTEQEAVFASISDGVLALDPEGLLLSINKAAARMFDLKRSKVRGRTVQEVIQNPSLRYFITRALQTEDEVEDEILLGDLDPHYIQAHGRPLRDENGRTMGAVVVLNDVTRLRRLEKARRDFVANVSHELRTPVTSIIGYIETLDEGALEDPEASHRFIHVIHRQSERLVRIIEDLLSLARIERDAESTGIELSETPVSEVISSALTTVDQLARARGIEIDVEVPGEIHAMINPPLLEQALINLLSNAIKYSDSHTRIEIKVRDKKKHVRIQVSDQGVGIAQQHLPRIFERFYRVDKGRSRLEGGTGLGLAIVKHIALAHGGRVSVESEPGQGSKFAIDLPKQKHLVQHVTLLETM